MFDWIRPILDLILRQTSKENFRNKSIRKTRVEIFEDKMAKESNTLEYMGDDFILKALTTEPRQIKWRPTILIADESTDNKEVDHPVWKSNEGEGFLENWMKVNSMANVSLIGSQLDSSK